MNDVAAPAAVDDALTVDRQHPWLGLASFTESNRAFFHGREEEVAELARRVQRKLLTILFGQSGLGKTSILRAGLVPKLRPDGYCPVYVRIDYASDAPLPSEQIKQAIFRETATSGRWTQTGVAAEGESLWEFLHHRDDLLKDADGRTIVPLLIFDQFEEVFTIAQGDAQGRERAAQFLTDLADLVENRPPKMLEARLDEDDSAIERFDFARADYRVLIALREDYLAHLEGLKSLMPSITQNRMRLARMTGAQALQAVLRPGGRLVSEEVAEAIVRFVAGGAELRNAEVEPALLSLVCRELNNARIAQGRSEISADVLAGSRDTILTEFYERALADQSEGVRRVIEEYLLTESGYRESLAEERLRKLLIAAGATPEALAKLVDRRLLRVEERLDVRRVELTHDVLTGVVKASRDVRLEREAREEAERRLAVQRERERGTRKALIRARQIAAGCAVLAVLAVASAIYGYISTERAKTAEAKAEATGLMAEKARGEAEKLVVFLLDDFQLELAPVGRLDIVAGLAKRAIDYYAGLPDALRTSDTERNRALALVRYGSALRTLGRIEEGEKVTDEAIAVLSRARERGDTSEATAIGLALGLVTRARLASSAELGGRALQFSGRAVETIRPFATATGASIAARRTFGEVMNLHGFLEMRSDLPEAAIASLQEARKAFRSIDDGSLSDLPAAAGYAEATSWLVGPHQTVERGEQAVSYGREAIESAERILERRPGHMQALRAKTLAASGLATFLFDEMQLREALRYNVAAEQGWREFLALDPGNAISRSNLAGTLFFRSLIVYGQGRVEESAAASRAALQIDRPDTSNALLRSQFTDHAGRLAMLESMLGNDRASEAALALSSQHRVWMLERSPEGSFHRGLYTLQTDWWRYLAINQRGDPRTIYELGQSLVPRLDALAPGPAELRGFSDNASFTLLSQARVASMLNEHAVALRHAARGVEYASRWAPVDASDWRRLANVQAVYGLALARSGRIEEGKAQAAKALATHRRLAATRHDDASHALDLAMAVHAAGAAGVLESRAAYEEALAILDKLSSELRKRRYTGMIREWIVADRAAGQ